MNIPRIMDVLRIDSAAKLAATYATFGALWIVVSDALMALESRDGLMAWARDSAKGLLFIGVTAGLLYVLVRRLIGRHMAAEEALRESQLRWQFALEGAGDGLWDWDAVTNRVVYSQQWKAMLGYAEHEIGDSLTEWETRVHPDDLPRVKAEIKSYFTGESPVYRSEYRIRAKDGSHRWILDRGQVVRRLPDGRPARMIGTHTDITDRKNAEERTGDALAFAQAILHSSPVGLIVYGPDGRAVIANEFAARIIGADVAALLRQSFREWEAWRQAGLLAAAERTLATGREEMQNTSLTTSSGRHLQVEVRLVPFDFQGARHLLAVISDETAKRQALDNLHLLQAALQAAPSAWVITDAVGAIEWVNPAFTRLTGYPAAEVIGQTPRVLRSDRQSPEFYQQFWETIGRGEIWSGEICNRRKDGTLYDERMTVAPVRDGDGVIRHFVAIKDDVTERKQLEQQLTRTQRLESIGMLASGIAHDLNNVLTPILLSIELLRTKYPAPDAKKYVDTVETAAQRGAGIVRQVLTFARGLDGGERTEVQPRYLLKDVVHLIEETFPRNIDISYEVPHDVRPVMADLTQLHQVILNLAVNARDAMPHGGTLTLAARNFTVEAGDVPAHPRLKPGEHVALSVADSGTGIPPEVLEHMFEPFYTTKPRGKGTGLGLSTVYGIVRSHGGTIEVRTKLGQGSTFEVLLPAAPANSAAPGPVEVAPALLGAGRRVLVVDDEEAIRSVTQRVLSRHGFVPVLAVDGTDGLRAVLGNPRDYAVAIVDMMMPRMSGADLVRNLRLAVPGLPVIISTGMMTGDSESGPGVGLGELGVHAFLPKPYTAEELLAALARVLDREGARPAR